MIVQVTVMVLEPTLMLYCAPVEAGSTSEALCAVLRKPCVAKHLADLKGKPIQAQAKEVKA
jgi:hypothetical protein